MDANMIKTYALRFREIVLDKRVLRAMDRESRQPPVQWMVLNDMIAEIAQNECKSVQEFMHAQSLDFLRLEERFRKSFLDHLGNVQNAS